MSRFAWTEVRDWGTLKWKVAVCLLTAFMFTGMGVWWILLGTICQGPSVPVAATGRTVQYNCHGSVVFITPFQDRLLHWLIPVMFVVGGFGQWLIRRYKRT
jgi:hypothetical protein